MHQSALYLLIYLHCIYLSIYDIIPAAAVSNLSTVYLDRFYTIDNVDVRPDPHKKYIADIEEDARRGDDFEHQHEDSASKVPSEVS